jgi:hypothetical protein
MRILVFALLAFFFLVAFATRGATALHEAEIRCKVCERAIQYVWDQGYELRNHCKSPERSDPRCDYSQLHRFGIEEMVHEVCDKLPRTHQAIEGSEFDLVLKDNPEHSDEVASLLRTTCNKWLHQEHGLDQIALYVYANLDAGKHTATILRGLQDRYCKKRACKADYSQSTNIENIEHANARYQSASKSKPDF